MYLNKFGLGEKAITWYEYEYLSVKDSSQDLASFSGTKFAPSTMPSERNVKNSAAEEARQQAAHDSAAMEAAIAAAAAEAGTSAASRPLMTADEVRKVIEEGTASVQELEKGINSIVQDKSLARTLGRAIYQRNKNTQSLIKEWDRNRDGVINKVEWRVAIRNILQLKASNDSLDALFDGAPTRVHHPCEASTTLNGRTRHRARRASHTDAQPLCACAPRLCPRFACSCSGPHPTDCHPADVQSSTPTGAARSTCKR